MGTIRACCGHDVTDEWDKSEEVRNGVSWKDYTRECEIAVAYGVLCKKCIEQYRKLGILLETEQAESDWLQRNEAEPCRKSQIATNSVLVAHNEKSVTQQRV